MRPTVQERAAAALAHLKKQNSSAHEAIAKAANPTALVELLKSSSMQEAKDYALWSLSLSIDESNQTSVAEAGGVDALIGMLSDMRAVIQAHNCLLRPDGRPHMHMKQNDGRHLRMRRGPTSQPEVCSSPLHSWPRRNKRLRRWPSSRATTTRRGPW